MQNSAEFPFNLTFILDKGVLFGYNMCVLVSKRTDFPSVATKRKPRNSNGGSQHV